MEILNLKKEKNPAVAAKVAAAYLKDGKVIVYPTDTVYGFGCDAKNEQALETIRRLKMRQGDKPFSVIARNLAMVKKYAIFGKREEIFLSRLLPGKFTVILKSKNKLPEQLAGRNKTLGIRIPDYPLTKEISKNFQDLYITTSVNFSEEEPEIEGEEIIRKFRRRFPHPDLIINAGSLSQEGKRPLASTVIDLTEQKPKILRLGVMNPQKLLELFQAWGENAKK